MKPIIVVSIVFDKSLMPQMKKVWSNKNIFKNNCPMYYIISSCLIQFSFKNASIYKLLEVAYTY
jgi:hypothetical protein